MQSSIYQTLSVCVVDPDVLPSPRAGSDVSTPRTWSGPPTRAGSLEAGAIMAPIPEHVALRLQQHQQLQHQQLQLQQQRDVCDVKARSRDQTRRKPTSAHQLRGLDVAPVADWD